MDLAKVNLLLGHKTNSKHLSKDVRIRDMPWVARCTSKCFPVDRCLRRLSQPQGGAMFKSESVLLSDYLKDWYKSQNTLSCFRNTLQVVPAPSFSSPGRVHPGLHFDHIHV